MDDLITLARAIEVRDATLGDYLSAVVVTRNSIEYCALSEALRTGACIGVGVRTLAPEVTQ